MTAFPLAAGDLGTLVFVVIVILVGLLRLIGQLATKVQGPGRPAVGPRPVRPPGGEVQQQIEEFLRRASQRQPPAGAGAAGETGAGPGAARAAGQPSAQPAAAEAAPDEAVGGRVVRQVRQYLDTSEFRRRSAQLGEEVAQSDEQFTDRAQHAFSADVSMLAKRPGQAADAPQTDESEAAPSAGQTSTGLFAPGGLGFAELLTSPDQVAHAIILNEILRRPEWD
ncbi:MAG: hypothetical protein ABSF26_07340 [Thermoguttaceae bacterium]|jgi:Na+-transporting methylmalonyl-CoA/oxaloacetate decarboxylase gamma subunit